ncbi:MAG TPA: hypothetical protein VMT16_00550 [Thermoanaerobaculia bacterium]|nr:hypothetical protein [Thermoanaerobaculia bacterium]
MPGRLGWLIVPLLAGYFLLLAWQLPPRDTAPAAGPVAAPAATEGGAASPPLHPRGLAAVRLQAARSWPAAVARWSRPALATLAVLLLFLVVAEGAGGAWGLLAAALLVTMPAFGEQALAGTAPVAVAALLLLALWLLLLWDDTPTFPRAFFAGLALGALPIAQPATAVLALGVLAFFAVTLADNRRRWRGLLAAALGVCLPLALALALGWRAADGGSATGGEPLGDRFAWSHVAAHAPLLLHRLLRETGGVLVLGLGGMLGMSLHPRTRNLGLALLGFVLPPALLVMAWSAPPDLRLLLPGLPLLVAAAAWMLSGVQPRQLQVALVVAMTALHLALAVPAAADWVERATVPESPTVDLEAP